MAKSLSVRALSFALVLLPVTYFLAPTSTVSFFPSYLIGIFGLVSIFLHRNLLIDIKTSVLGLLGLFLVLLVSVQVGSGSVSTTALYFGYTLLILTFILGYYIAASEVAWFSTAFMMSMVGAALISSLVSIYLFFTLDYQPLDENRLYALGRLSNPVISAISYSSVLCLCLAFIPNSKELGLRLIVAAITICLTVAVWLTESRGAWLGLLAASACIFFIYDWQSKLQIILASTVLLVIATLTIILLTSSGYTEILMKRSFSFRPEIWMETLRIWWSGNVLLGAGMQTLIDLNIPPNRFLHPHSIYVSTLFYGGVLGLVGLFAFLGRLVWILQRCADQEIRIYAYPLLAFGLTTLLFDGNKLIEKVDFLWLCLWLPVTLVLLAEGKLKRQIQSQQA